MQIVLSFIESCFIVLVLMFIAAGLCEHYYLEHY